MSETSNQEIIHHLADQLLARGIRPTREQISDLIGAQVAVDIDAALEEWWRTLEGRLTLLPGHAPAPSDGISRAIRALWEDAVREALSMLSVDRHRLDVDLEHLRKESEDSMRSERKRYEELEELHRNALARAESLEEQFKVIGAEVDALKGSLANEVALRNQAEKREQDLRVELKRAQQALEDAKKLFDNRIRDEQRRAQEQQNKAESDVRYLRVSLERLRDDAGKKEASLTKTVHDFQAELAKRDVKIETLQGQLKGLEAEHRAVRAEADDRGREVAKLTSKLLSETNRAKRQEDQLKQAEAVLKESQQKLVTQSGETTRREAELRQQLKGRDEELVRLKARLASAEKKLLTYEEQLRRHSRSTPV